MTTGTPGELVDAPTSRRLIGRSFDLDIRSSRELRNASLFMASQFLLVVGPVLFVVAVLFIRLPAFIDMFDPTLVEPGSFDDLGAPYLAFFVQLMLASSIAVIGGIAITIESQIIAIAVLAGRLVGRPVTLRQAVARSRQTFWRMVRASILVGIPAVIAGLALEGTVGQIVDPESEGYLLVSLAVGVLVAIPFAYVPAGIVLGDVGAREAIARGFRLVRAHRSIAVVIALFTAAAQFLQFFAIGAGGDIVVRVGVALNLGFDHGDAQSALTYVLIVASIVAVGTLLFTTIAIAVAPQVVAFIALAKVQTGLDRVLDPVAPPTVEPAVEPAVASTVEPTVEPALASALEPDPRPSTPGPDSFVVEPFVVAPARTFWDEVPVVSPSQRIISIPMIVGGILAIVFALAALGGIESLGPSIPGG